MLLFYFVEEEEHLFLVAGEGASFHMLYKEVCLTVLGHLFSGLVRWSGGAGMVIFISCHASSKEKEAHFILSSTTVLHMYNPLPQYSVSISLGVCLFGCYGPSVR